MQNFELLSDQSMSSRDVLSWSIVSLTFSLRFTAFATAFTDVLAGR